MIVDFSLEGEGGGLPPLAPLREGDCGNNAALTYDGKCRGGGVPIEYTRGIES